MFSKHAVRQKGEKFLHVSPHFCALQKQHQILSYLPLNPNGIRTFHFPREKRGGGGIWVKCAVCARAIPLVLLFCRTMGPHISSETDIRVRLIWPCMALCTVSVFQNILGNRGRCHNLRETFFSAPVYAKQWVSSRHLHCNIHCARKSCTQELLS